MAPEHLRDQVPGLKGSEKGDVYSISIIMQCVVLRSEPYSTSGLTPTGENIVVYLHAAVTQVYCFMQKGGQVVNLQIFPYTMYRICRLGCKRLFSIFLYMTQLK
jgi:hypothetical protein